MLVHNLANPKRSITFTHARGTTSIHTKQHKDTKIQILTWVKPPYKFFKLNTDASYTIKSHSSFGGILRDHLGKMIFGYYGPITASSPLEAEFIAILIGCRICKFINLDFKQLILESDNSTLVDSINAFTCPIFNHLSHWVELINYTNSMHYIKHIFRETNAVADLLAKQGKHSGNFTLHFDMPMFTKNCRNHILLDQWSVPYIKISTNN
jgi:hypothetical protein